MKYTMTSPCAECPFRRDRAGFLTRPRAQAIADGLLAPGETCTPFPCHKTIDYGLNTDGCQTANTQHCAGALILLEKIGQPHLAMILGRQLGEYPGRPDVGNPYVFHKMKEFVEHHARKLPGDASPLHGDPRAKKDFNPRVERFEELPDEPEWRPVGKP